MRPRMEGLATQIGVAIHYLRTPDLEQRDAKLHFNAGSNEGHIYQKQNCCKFLMKTKRLLQIKRKQYPPIIETKALDL